jgi:hypothetical protein
LRNADCGMRNLKREREMGRWGDREIRRWGDTKIAECGLRNADCGMRNPKETETEILNFKLKISNFKLKFHYPPFNSANCRKKAIYKNERKMDTFAKKW